MVNPARLDKQSFVVSILSILQLTEDPFSFIIISPPGCFCVVANSLHHMEVF